MYSEKFDQISNASLSQLALGHGPGSDLIDSQQWWWGKRGAHNDYLTALIEQGMVFLLLLLLLLAFIVRYDSNRSFHIIFSAYLFASLVSNGFMSRPLCAYILFMVAVYFSHKVRPPMPTIGSVPISVEKENGVTSGLRNRSRKPATGGLRHGTATG